MKKPARMAANMFGSGTGLSSVADTPLNDVGNIREGSSGRQMDANLINALAQEMLKLVHNEQHVTDQQQENLSHYAHLAGKSIGSSHFGVCCACDK